MPKFTVATRACCTEHLHLVEAATVEAAIQLALAKFQVPLIYIGDAGLTTPDPAWLASAPPFAYPRFDLGSPGGSTVMPDLTSTPDLNMAFNASTEPAVACAVCGHHWPIDSLDYIAVYGNITLGRRGGIVGNNFDDAGKVAHVACYCAGDCFPELIARAVREGT